MTLSHSVLLLCIAVVTADSLAHALTLCLALAVQLLIGLGFSALLQLCRLPARSAVWLLSAATAYALLALSVYTPYPLEITPLSLTTLFLCGTLNIREAFSIRLWLRGGVAVLWCGALRELLGHGTVLSVTLFDPLPITINATAVALIAAAVVWILRLSVPLVQPTTAPPLQTAVITALLGAVSFACGIWLPLSWQLPLTAVVCALLTRLAPFSVPLSPLLPALPLFFTSWWQIPIAAIALPLLLWGGHPLWERWRRRPLSSTFVGPPAAFTITAITLSILHSF